METAQKRLEAVEAQVCEACDRSERDRHSVSIVAISKACGPDAVTALAEAGQIIFGENRVQEARQKIPDCPSRLEWHMVGHLQGNKVRDAVSLFSMIHSADSLKLLQAINVAAEEAAKSMPVCLEVNVSGESSKFGLPPDAVPELLEQCTRLIHVDVVGLMTIPPFTPESENARPFFARLRNLRDEWARASGFDLSVLSMGMSNDFQVAIEEGATHVRIGTLLFGGRT